jgi:hypothetical protein
MKCHAGSLLAVAQGRIDQPYRGVFHIGLLGRQQRFGGFALFERIENDVHVMSGFVQVWCPLSVTAPSRSRLGNGRVRARSFGFKRSLRRLRRIRGRRLRSAS